MEDEDVGVVDRDVSWLVKDVCDVILMTIVDDVMSPNTYEDVTFWIRAIDDVILMESVDDVIVSTRYVD